MIPRIFSIGPIPVNSFGLMVALALLVAIYRLGISFERNGLRKELAEKYALLGGVSGLLGARIWYLIRHYSEIKDNFLSALLSGAGFTFYGGFIVAVIAIFIALKKDKIKLAPFVDSVGPALCLAYAVGRVGCQLSGDGDYGFATNSFLGMSYSTAIIPTAPGVLVYPAPVFESIMSCIVLIFLSRAEISQKWQSMPYARFGLYLVLMSIERFIVEFVRVEMKFAYGLSEAHYIAIGLTMIGVVLLGVGWRCKEKVES